MEHTSRVVISGVPFDAYSSFLQGPALAPGRIREALRSNSTNMSTENGLDLSKSQAWFDAGDVTLTNDAGGYARIAPATEELLGQGGHVLSLGGDHSITYPLVQAHARKYPGLNILHLDAHPDLYDEFEGNRHSHACPFARIMEAHLAHRLVQVGIRTANSHQRAQAERFGVEQIKMRRWQPDSVLAFDGPLYLSLDMDVLDPAFAPGISHPEPGGLSTREVLRIIQITKGNLVGADIVEYNPTRDPSGVTAMAAAKFLKEIVARMLE
ncbi:MAG: agmatinase [Anaerolineae bacterium]